MTKSNSRNFDIEVLEPLVLMSASPAACEAIDPSQLAEGNEFFNLQGLNPFSVGGEGCDTLLGLGGGFEISGADGNDWLLSVRGENKLDGGSGHDTVAYWGQRAEYTIEDQGFGIFAVKGGGCGGEDKEVAAGGGDGGDAGVGIRERTGGVVAGRGVADEVRGEVVDADVRGGEGGVAEAEGFADR